MPPLEYSRWSHPERSPGSGPADPPTLAPGLARSFPSRTMRDAGRRPKSASLASSRVGPQFENGGHRAAVRRLMLLEGKHALLQSDLAAKKCEVAAQAHENAQLAAAIRQVRLDLQVVRDRSLQRVAASLAADAAALSDPFSALSAGDSDSSDGGRQGHAGAGQSAIGKFCGGFGLSLQAAARVANLELTSLCGEPRRDVDAAIAAEHCNVKSSADVGAIGAANTGSDVTGGDPGSAGVFLSDGVLKTPGGLEFTPRQEYLYVYTSTFDIRADPDPLTAEPRGNRSKIPLRELMSKMLALMTGLL
eukprot:SAG31_NODE_2925_length_4905_cov_2.222222_5_plen_305_part_00